ncbi:MAG TPA: STAS domain-containing protein [Vicinamibacterales bacterium]|nr:STAS domain-containing protein [Vicinamibacterales bacterium]
MQISERQVGKVTVIDISGKVVLGDGGDSQVKEKLLTLAEKGQKKLLVNLAEVTYVDSAGLGAIVHSYTAVTKQGGELKLVNATKRIRDLLAITKLLTVFEIFDSEADALRSFG